jgi:hypothetical protein
MYKLIKFRKKTIYRIEKILQENKAETSSLNSTMFLSDFGKKTKHKSFRFLFLLSNASWINSFGVCMWKLCTFYWKMLKLSNFASVVATTTFHGRDPFSWSRPWSRLGAKQRVFFRILPMVATRLYVVATRGEKRDFWAVFDFFKGSNPNFYLRGSCFRRKGGKNWIEKWKKEAEEAMVAIRNAITN